jgi:hypothetical protein
MEQVIEGLGTALHALLGTAILLGPGLLFWLLVASVIVTFRWVGQKLPLKKLSGSPSSQRPTTIKS